MLRAFGHLVATCWVLLAQIWPVSNLSQRHPTRRNMSQQGGQTHATCCAQQCCNMLSGHVAIVWPGLYIRQEGLLHHWFMNSVWGPLSYNKNQSYCRILISPNHDLLGDRRTIDVIIPKFFPLCFNVTGRKVKYKSCRGIKQEREEGRRKKKPSQSSQLNQTQTGLEISLR